MTERVAHESPSPKHDRRSVGRGFRAALHPSGVPPARNDSFAPPPRVPRRYSPGIPFATCLDPKFAGDREKRVDIRKAVGALFV